MRVCTSDHLDMETVDVLATAIRNFKGAVVAISHDKHFLQHAVSEFWSLRDGTVATFDNLDEARRHANQAKAQVDLD